MSKIKKEYYLQEDVVQVSKDLIGKTLFTKIDGQLCGGIISETEAYNGAVDKACHAYNNRRTKRTEIMFGEGGTAYVYLCYGIHHLFNIVTNQKDIPTAILIRAVHPIKGVPQVLKRRKQERVNPKTAGGPGTVSQALGIHTKHTGTSLTGSKIWLEENGLRIPSKKITAGPRIGVDYAEEDALLPYRFKIEHQDLLTYL